MPAKAARTATPTAKQAWNNVQPGDIFFTTGAGIVGSLIRRGTESPYGHCGIVHDPRGNRWLTAEAFPSFPPWRPGLQFRNRHPNTVAAVLRVWRNQEERLKILETSAILTAERLPYAWSEILIIAASNILPHSWIPSTDLTRAVICSNHVAQCLLASRGSETYEAYFRYSPNRMWPGGLTYDLHRLLWKDRYG